ncbi:MAG: polysaccharide deacetylase family protein [Ferruginibacter sp.]|nr:polysaccharide deacetylase family protein [Ferruginibacter sp.]
MVFFSKQTAVILLLHRVSPERNVMWDPMDPALFEQVLKYVQRRFHTIPLNELLFQPRAVSSRPLAAITFDDGYKDFIDCTIPLLKKYNMPAGIFVTTDCIENNLPTWTYLLDYVFERSKILSLRQADFGALPAEYRIANWHSDAQRILYGKKIKQYLKWVPAVLRKAIIQSLLSNLNDVSLPSGMMMSWEDVKQVHTAGYEVGPHSVTHPTLATIEDDEELDYELIYAGQQLKEKAGIDSPVFSYPCGSYDDRVIAHTRRAGYKAGLAVNRRLYKKVAHDIFAIPRIELYNESWLKSRLRINGTISFIEKIIKP